MTQVSEIKKKCSGIEDTAETIKSELDALRDDVTDELNQIIAELSKDAVSEARFLVRSGRRSAPRHVRLTGIVSKLCVWTRTDREVVRAETLGLDLESAASGIETSPASGAYATRSVTSRFRRWSYSRDRSRALWPT